MTSVEKSVVTSLDGSDSRLFPFLPYILQDLWEIGASSESIIKLLCKHTSNHSNLKILDLGCGKGVISVRLAKKFNCACVGIDAIEEFIKEATKKAKEYGVEKRCQFEVGDIRKRVTELKDFDIIILGAIGPVFGNYFSTLSTISKCFNEHGLVLIDDGYIEDESSFSHPLMEKRSSILKQITQAGMKLRDEIIVTDDEIKSTDDLIFQKVKKRCQELIEKYPEKSTLFLEYIKKQEEENEILETKVICSTMLIGRK